MSHQGPQLEIHETYLRVNGFRKLAAKHVFCSLPWTPRDPGRGVLQPLPAIPPTPGSGTLVTTAERGWPVHVTGISRMDETLLQRKRSRAGCSASGPQQARPRRSVPGLRTDAHIKDDSDTRA